jgi:hypothetical protein
VTITCAAEAIGPALALGRIEWVFVIMTGKDVSSRKDYLCRLYS